MATWLQRASELGEGVALFSGSWRSSWRQWRGWAVPNAVGRLPCSARPWRKAFSSPATAGAGRGQVVVQCVPGTVVTLKAEEGVQAKS